jgi:YidC/Oxa1 family membrane protein insertase
MPLLIMLGIGMLVLTMMMPKDQPEPSGPTPPGDQPPVMGDPNNPADTDPGTEGPVAEAGPHPTDIEPAEITVTTDQYTVVLSNVGGVMKSLTMNRYTSPYRDLEGKEHPFTLISSLDHVSDSFDLFREDGSGHRHQTTTWETSHKKTDGQEIITYTYTFPDKVKVHKTFIFGNIGTDADLDFRFELEVVSTSAEIVKPDFRMTGFAGLMREGSMGQYLNGVYAERVSEDRVHYDTVAVPEEEPALVNATSPIAWFGVQAKYFAGVLAIDTEVTNFQGNVRFDKIIDLEYAREKNIEQIRIGRIDEAAGDEVLKKDAEFNITSQYDLLEVVLENNGSRKIAFEVFVGPKDNALMNPYNRHGLKELIDYGFFGGISKILLGILAFFHRFTGNFGVSIILLVICIRAAMFFPLTLKMQKSSHAMQKLAPKIKELKEKFGKDKQKLGQEQMKLYREHGVNPLAGCLPMFIQIPIFFGLYRALELSITLRHAPFFGWISDLSQPDMLFVLPTWVPLPGDYFNLIPLLMGVAMFMNSWMMPINTADEQQAQQQKIMRFMPLIFIFILYPFQSGLNLYWFVSSLMGIFEIKLIRKVYLSEGVSHE